MRTIERAAQEIPLIFYSGTKNASSWSFRAWLALKEAGLAFDEVDIELRQPARQ